MKIRFGYKDTRLNGEDFALTPYLFLVNVKEYPFYAIGVGICFGFWSFYGVVGKVPKDMKLFTKHTL